MSIYSGGGVADSNLRIVSWEDGSKDDISAMLEAHYAGTIDISDYWKVGDIRGVVMSAITATTNGVEAQATQYIELLIIGLNHDDLATTNGIRTKAAITVQTKDCLSNTGYMNKSSTGILYSLWSTSSRRSLCMDKFRLALPTYVQNLIKPVIKLTNRFCNSKYSDYESCRIQETTTDTCFLLSEWEVFGKQNKNADDYGELDADGVQYEYLQSADNLTKYTGFGNTNELYWFTRTSYMEDGPTDYFISCIWDFTYVGTKGYTSLGIAPAFCL